MKTHVVILILIELVVILGPVRVMGAGVEVMMCVVQVCK